MYCPDNIGINMGINILSKFKKNLNGFGNRSMLVFLIS